MPTYLHIVCGYCYCMKTELSSCSSRIFTMCLFIENVCWHLACISKSYLMLIITRMPYQFIYISSSRASSLWLSHFFLQELHTLCLYVLYTVRDLSTALIELSDSEPTSVTLTPDLFHSGWDLCHGFSPMQRTNIFLYLSCCLCTKVDALNHLICLLQNPFYP